MKTRVFVVFIGPGWLKALNWVRIEIQKALGSSNIEILPVLIDDSEMPQLPEDLRGLAKFNALKLRPYPDFPNDVAAISVALERLGVKRSGAIFSFPSYTTKLQNVWVMRHTRAAKVPIDAGFAADMARQLTEEGQVHADAAGASLRAKGIDFVSVGASPARRALETASRLSGRNIGAVSVIKALVPPDPASGRDAPRVDFLYDNIGDAALSGYRIVDRDARTMDRYGRRVWRGVRAFLQSSQAGDVDRRSCDLVSSCFFLRDTRAYCSLRRIAAEVAE